MDQIKTATTNLDFGIPKLYKLREVIIINIISIIAGCFMAFAMWVSLIFSKDVIVQTSIIISGIILFIYFLPLLGNVNFYVKMIVRKIDHLKASNGYIFQLTIDPRLFKGFRGFLENADDIGILSLQEEQLSFHGDCINLCMPYSEIESMQTYNAGWRGLWLCGKIIEIKLKNDKQYKSFKLSERHSSTVLKSFNIGSKVANIICEKMKKV